MKRATTLTALAAACALSVAAPGLAAPMATTSTAKTTTTTMTTTTSGALNDREILGVLQTVNLGEINAGKSAEMKASSSDVKAYAREMVRDHDHGEDGVRAAVKAVGTTETSALSKTLAADGKASMARLSHEKGGAFDRAYMADQVKMHQTALDTIDHELMPKATSEKVKDLLTKTRAVVAEHLQKAQALQSKLG